MHARVVKSVVLLALIGIAGDAGVAQGGADPRSRIDKVFERWTTGKTPGCAVGVAQGGRVVYTQGYGYANLEDGVRITPDTIFESGSVAKQFTAGAVALLVLDGRLSLDDPVRKFVPEVPDFGTPILVRHLLSHTSGLRSQWPLLTLAGRPPGMAVHSVPEIVELVTFQRELNFTPGAEYLYNNTAFTLLTVVVERVSGQPFADFCRERLFKPIGMPKTQWRDDFTRIVEGRAAAYRSIADGGFRNFPSITNVIGNGGLLTTVGDLLRWNEQLDRPRVGGQAWAEMLQTPARLNDGTMLDYALGLVVQDYRGVREVGHGGSTAGYQTYLMRMPDEKLSVAVLCNTTGANPSGYAHQIAEIMLGGRLKPVGRVAATSVRPETLQRLVGAYRNRRTDAMVRLSWDKERNVIRAAGQELVPTAPGVLSSPDGARTYTLEVPGGGAGWPTAGPPVSVTEHGGTDASATWHYEAPFLPTAAQLQEYEGAYVSEELGVTYAVLRTDAGLIIRFRPAQLVPLAPAFADGFEGAGNTYRFTRDRTGRIDGLRVYAGRARQVRFVRQAG